MPYEKGKIKKYDEVEKLTKELRSLQTKQKTDMKVLDLKKQINTLHRKEKIKAFDKKHKILGAIGRVGHAVTKVVTTPPTEAKQKIMKQNKDKLKKLINLY